MSLIACPDCGNKISDQAPNCPTCGRPISGVENLQQLVQEHETKRKENKSRKTKNILAVLLFISLIVAAIGFAYYESTSFDRARDALYKSSQEFKEASDAVDEIERQLEENQRLIDAYKQRQ